MLIHIQNDLHRDIRISLINAVSFLITMTMMIRWFIFILSFLPLVDYGYTQQGSSFRDIPNVSFIDTSNSSAT